MKLRYQVKRILGNFGLELRRVPKSGRRQPAWLTHPVTADYLPEYRGSLIVDADISDARGLSVLGLPFTEAHPFLRAAKAGLEARDETDRWTRVRTVLDEASCAFQPASALEAINLSEAEAPGLASQPPHACLLPWSPRTVAQTVKGRNVAMEEAGHQYRVKLGVGDGLTAFGPWSTAKLDLETKRIVNLLQSVQNCGFGSFDPQAPIKANALLKDGNLRWQIEEGNHRLPVAAASGTTSMSLMVVQTIRRDDASLWPRVADGTFTQSGALAVFDRIFAG